MISTTMCFKPKSDREEDPLAAERSKRTAAKRRNHRNIVTRCPRVHRTEKVCKWQAAGDDTRCWHTFLRVGLQRSFMRRSGRTRPRWRSNLPYHYVCALCTLLRGASVFAGDAVHGRQTVSTALDERRSPSSRGQKHTIRDVESRRYRDPANLHSRDLSKNSNFFRLTRRGRCCEQRSATWQASAEEQRENFSTIVGWIFLAPVHGRCLPTEKQILRSSSTVYDSCIPAWERDQYARVNRLSVWREMVRRLGPAARDE